MNHRLDPEIGFTSGVIRDPRRFVGRKELIRNCIRSLNSATGLIAIYGKRGVGKSSLLRQVQQMALGDYTLAQSAGLYHEIPDDPKKYLTVFYSCDSLIKDGADLISRLCKDSDPEDGLLRLVPMRGKELSEFTRTEEANAGVDLKVVKWGAKGTSAHRYSDSVPNDTIQTFRNFVNSIISEHSDKLGYDGLLILLDEFDVIQNKSGIGSIIKSLSSERVKFGISGVGDDLIDLVTDHASVERLIEQGAIHVKPMLDEEAEEIVARAEILFGGEVNFDPIVKQSIASMSGGYPYLVQSIGKDCVSFLNIISSNEVNEEVLNQVNERIKSGDAFPTLEQQYQRAIGKSDQRQILLHLLAEQERTDVLFNEANREVLLRDVRGIADDFDIKYVDQLVPRLVDPQYGPVLSRVGDRAGVYEFTSPIFRLYVKLRKL